MTMTLPAAPDAPVRASGTDDAKALIQRECQRVAGETVPVARKRVLMAAAMTLGKETGVALEDAGPALYAATRFARYPDVLDGEDIARIIRTSLAAGRQHSAGYGDGTVAPPTAPPAPAADPELAPDVLVEDRPDPEPALPAASDSVLQRADVLTPAPVDWLWKNHIARGKLTLIGGAPSAPRPPRARSHLWRKRHLWRRRHLCLRSRLQPWSRVRSEAPATRGAVSCREDIYVERTSMSPSVRHGRAGRRPRSGHPD
jgi:hypothetical protein